MHQKKSLENSQSDPRLSSLMIRQYTIASGLLLRKLTVTLLPFTTGVSLYSSTFRGGSVEKRKKHHLAYVHVCTCVILPYHTNVYNSTYVNYCRPTYVQYCLDKKELSLVKMLAYEIGRRDKLTTTLPLLCT